MNFKVRKPKGNVQMKYHSNSYKTDTKMRSVGYCAVDPAAQHELS